MEGLFNQFGESLAKNRELSHQKELQDAQALKVLLEEALASVNQKIEEHLSESKEELSTQQTRMNTRLNQKLEEQDKSNNETQEQIKESQAAQDRKIDEGIQKIKDELFAHVETSIKDELFENLQNTLNEKLTQFLIQRLSGAKITI